MNNQLRLTMIIMFILIVFEVFSTTNFETGEKIPKYVLEDIYKKEHHSEDLMGNVIVLVMGNKAGFELNSKFADQLTEEYSFCDSVKVFNVMDMRGIPKFLSKNKIRKKLNETQEDYITTLILDWNQEFNNLIGTKEDETTLLILDKKGVVSWYSIGILDLSKYELMVSEIDAVLNQ